MKFPTALDKGNEDLEIESPVELHTFNAMGMKRLKKITFMKFKYVLAMASRNQMYDHNHEISNSLINGNDES